MSSWFVDDLLVDRPDPKASHIVQAIGSSSLDKGSAFAEKHCAGRNPSVYGSYKQVYADPQVEVIYVGTPHGLHKRDCLDAIEAGKHVLCEKAFTLSTKEAEEVFAAAKAKGVFVMEAMWLRFMPVVQELKRKIYEEGAIGEVRRIVCDFSMDMGIRKLGPESRLRNPSLGAGSLLDIGIYPLTWALLTLSDKLGEEAEMPDVAGLQSLYEGIDIASAFLLRFPSTGKLAVLSCSTEGKTDRAFCRIEGTSGTIKVEGQATSHPAAFSIWRRATHPDPGDVLTFDKENETFRFDQPPGQFGYYYEADAVAVDIAAHKTENALMPWAETIRVMKILDEIRRQGGARFPQDDE